MTLTRLMLLMAGLIGTLWLSACATKPEADTPTSGRLALASDEALRPLVSTTARTFEGLYPQSKISTFYGSQERAFQLLLADSVRAVAATRGLNEAERAHFATQRVTAREYPWARDAVLVVVNRANPDSIMSLAQLRAIVTGRLREWPGRGGRIVPVLDQLEGANRYALLEALSLPPDAPLAELYAAGAGKEVIEYVRTHPEAIGFVGAGLLSDGGSRQVRELRRQIVMVALSRREPALPDSAFQPYQADIATGAYPLSRTIYLITGEHYNGLGTGLAAFALSDVGQRVVLKAGLVPLNIPGREIILNGNTSNDAPDTARPR